MKTHRTSAFRLFQPSAFRLSGFFLAAFSLLLPLRAAIVYWDPGTTGTWFTPNGWRDDSATGALRNAPDPSDEVRIDNGHVTIGPGVSVPAGNVYVGRDANAPGTLLIEGGGVLASSNFYAGRVANSNGRIIVADYASVTASAYAIIGYSGTGYLDIAPRGVVQTTQYFNLGQDTNGRGFASVEGALHVGSYMLVGRTGQGTRGVLDVAPGGVVSIGTYLDVGSNAGTFGSLNLSGSLSVGTYAYIGGSGTGTGAIASTGSMRVTGSTFVGNAAGSHGTFNVAGIYDSDGAFRIGNNGAGIVTIEDGGRINVTSAIETSIGFGATSSGTLVVESGGVWNSNGGMAIGVSATTQSHVKVAGAMRVGGNITLASGAAAIGLLEITGAPAGVITGADGASPVTITGGAGSARVVFSHSDASYTFANNLSGSLALEHNGAGLTTLTGAASHTGGTIVRSGTLAGNAANLRGAITTESAGTLLFDQAAAASFAGTLSGAGSLAKTGAGTLTLATADIAAFTGMLDVRVGTLELNTGAAAFAWNGSFAPANATATLLKTGAGSLALATPGFAFAGTLDVSQGAVTLAPGATLGAVNVATGAAFSGGGSTVTGTLTLAQNSMLNFDLATPSTTLLSTGALLATGTTLIDFTNLKNGAHTIITAGDLFASASNFIYTVNGNALSGRNSVDFTFGANDISIDVSILSLRVLWAAPGGGIWDAITSNWSAAGDDCFTNGDSVRFGSSAAGTVTIIPAGVTVSDIEVSSTGTLTLAGGALATNASAASVDGVSGLVSLGGTATDATTGKLAKKGAGTLTLANESGNFASGVEIEQGILSFNNAAQLDTTGTNITFTGAAELRADADILGTTAPLASDIAIAGVSATLNTQGHTVEYTGALSSSGAAAALAKTGDGSLILLSTDNSAFTAPVTVTAGALLLADGAQLGSALTATAGASAGGDGTFTGNVTINNGALLVGNVGTSLATPSSAPGALNITSDLTLTGSARVDFGIHAGGLADTLNVTGAITTAAATNIVGLSFGLIGSGTYALGNATALAGITNLEFNGALAEPSLRSKGELAASAGTLFFIYEMDASRHMEWTGAGGATRWNIALDNWQGYNGDTSGHLKFQDGDTVRFSTTANTTIAIDSAATVSDMLVDNDTGTLTFTGQAINTDIAVNGTLITNPLGKLIKTGAGALVFDNAANTFIGGVEINAGLLAFSNTAQLNTAGAGITFTGSGTLRALAPMTLADTLTLSGAGIVASLDTGASDITLNGALAGTGTLAKLGAGTLVLTNPGNPASIGYHIADGVLETDSAVLKTSLVTTEAAGTLVLDLPANVTYTPAITGPGAFEKRGEGVLTLATALGNTGATRILAGTLRTSANNQLNAASALIVGPEATLDLRNTRQAAGSLNLSGTLLMSATVNSNAGAILASDYLKASQVVIGDGTVNLSLTETEDDGYTFLNGPAPSSVVLIESADNSAADFTFDITGSPADAIFAWDVTKDGGNYVLGQKRLVPLIPAVAGINAALLIAAETTLDALSRQNAAMRLNTESGPRPGMDWWLNSTYRHDTIKETLYDGAQAITKSVQAGMNYTKAPARRRGNSPWTTGVFVDLVNTNMRMNDAEATTLSYKGGVHVGYRPNNAFYAGGIVFAGTSRHTIHVAGMPRDLSIGASGLGAALEMGYMIGTKSGWLVEPQAQIAWHSTNVAKAQDSAHRVFEIGNVVSRRERVGLQFARAVKLPNQLILRPSLRVAYNYENQGANTVSVTRYFDADRTRPRDRYDYTDDFTGGSLLLGGGVAMRVSEKFEALLDFSTKLGGKLRDYTINLGIAWRW